MEGGGIGGHVILIAAALPIWEWNSSSGLGRSRLGILA